MVRKLSVGVVAALALGLGLSSAEAQPPASSVVCNDESVRGLAGFNTVAQCPSGHFATGGGYELVSTDFSQLLGASVNESMPFRTPPTGWEVVGSNLTTIAGKIRVCVICN
jgi:hypothetical protein